jgi:hypothetical protein
MAMCGDRSRQARSIDGRKVWDIYELDAAFDELPLADVPSIAAQLVAHVRFRVSPDRRNLWRPMKAPSPATGDQIGDSALFVYRDCRGKVRHYVRRRGKPNVPLLSIGVFHKSGTVIAKGLSAAIVARAARAAGLPRPDAAGTVPRLTKYRPLAVTSRCGKLRTIPPVGRSGVRSYSHPIRP